MIKCKCCGALLSSGFLSGIVGKKLKMILTALIAVIVVTLVILGGKKLVSIAFGSDAPEETNYLIYFKDNAMLLSDLHSLKKEPIMVTDSVTNQSEVVLLDNILANHRQYLSENEKYIYYMENFDGITFDLYRVPLKKAGLAYAALKIDSKVQGFFIRSKESVLYYKNDILHYFDGQKTVEFGNHVKGYYYKDGSDYIVWKEAEGNFIYNLYRQDLAQKKEPVELAKNVSNLCSDSDYNTFYALKDDKLIKIGMDGKNETIDRNVSRLVSTTIYENHVYYIKENELHISAADVVYDDRNMISDAQKMALLNTDIEMKDYTLYRYSDGKSTEIATNVSKKNLYSRDDFCLFAVFPDFSSVRIPWSEVSELSDGNYSSTIRDLLEKQASPMLVSGNRGTVYNLARENSGNQFAIADYHYDDDNDRLYYILNDMNDEKGTLYYAEINSLGVRAGNKRAGNKLADVEADCRIVGAIDGGVYYTQNTNEYGSDMYFNTDLVADGVNFSIIIDNGTFIYSSGRNSDGSYLLDYYNGKSSEELEDFASYATAFNDGKVFFLADYDSIRNEGTLKYYDGKKIHVIDTDVEGFVSPSLTRTLYR